MAFKKGDVSLTFNNKFVIHGLHCNKEEAQKIMNEDGYNYIKVIEVKHGWATWGRLPEHLGGDVSHGWWEIKNNDGYKHKKKITFVLEAIDIL